MPLRAPVVFPLLSIVDGKCACGSPKCGRIGKHPAVKWRDVKLGDTVPRPAPGAGAGLKTGAGPRGSGVFVVDLDGQSAADLFDSLGGAPATYEVETPRAAGGWHLYFLHPGFRIKNSVGELGRNHAPGAAPSGPSGIDIRGDGGFVVAVGSPHRDGGVYRVTDERDPVPAPEWLLAWLRARSTPDTDAPAAYPGDVEDPDEIEYRRALLALKCKRADPAGAGGRHAALFPIVQHGAYDLALPVDDVLDVVADHYNPRCDPPMAEDELEESVRGHAHGAKTQSTRPRNEPWPADMVHLTLDRPVRPVLEPPRTAPDADPADPDDPHAFEGERWGGWDQTLPTVEYLLPGVIPRGKVTTFFAAGGSVKTFAALDLAISVATPGRLWLGKYPVLHGPALYMDWEDGPYEFQRRVQMLTRGQPVPDLGYVYGGPYVDKVEFWVKAAKRAVHKRLVYLVLDSLNAAMPADADENEAKFSAGVKLAGRFTEANDCTVTFIHHANKTGGMRGSTTIHDQSDAVFTFEPVDENDTRKRMRMTCTKAGPQRRPAPINIELTDAGLTTFSDDAQTAGRNAKTPNEIRAAILLALTGGSIATKKLVRIAVGGATEKVDAQLDALIATKEVVHLESGGYALDDDAKRTDRVLMCLRTGELFASAAKLAEAAEVSTPFVRSLDRRGVVADSGGRMIEVKK